MHCSLIQNIFSPECRITKQYPITPRFNGHQTTQQLIAWQVHKRCYTCWFPHLLASAQGFFLSTVPQDLLKKFRYLAYYQFIAAATGLLAASLLLYALNRAPHAAAEEYIGHLILGGVLCSLFTFICGGLLFYGKRAGLKLSLANFLLQSGGFSLFGIKYFYALGFHMIFLISPDAPSGQWIDADVGIQPFFTLLSYAQEPQTVFSINFFALALLAFVFKLRYDVQRWQRQPSLQAVTDHQLGEPAE